MENQQSKNLDQSENYAANPRKFGEAIKVCFQKYADFNGRASRSEYWYFQLFFYIVYFGTIILVVAFYFFAPLISALLAVLYIIFSFAVFLPALAVTVRRLHDIGQSGLWLLLIYPLCLILVGSIWLLAWLVMPSDLHDNGY